jgi:hypothetical protein
MIDDVVPFQKRRLCTLIASRTHSDHPDELHSAESRVAQCFAAAEGSSFDIFGWGWSPELNRSFRRVVSGVERLRRSKFSICYEAAKGWNGLVSGKVFESFAAGCVPVYRGAPNVADSIPCDCFIAGDDFRSEAELHAYLKNMSEGVHEAYLDRIRAFLSSERAVPYSASHFVRTFVDMVGGRAARGPVPPRPTNRRRGVADNAGARQAGLMG